MELQWKSQPCGYLRCMTRQVQNQEQTLELRLTEGMPDIGRVLCAWGQVMLRSKEWRNDSIGAAGGVNAWVLYLPEDGSEPRCVEGWLPFQAKWNLSDSQREGTIRVDALLRGLDARTLSARKLMVRASVSILAEALEPAEAAIYTPDELPQQVQLLKRTYPMMLPREAGEKLLNMEESLPVSGPKPRKLLCCRVKPLVTEQAVLGGRVVMRGLLRLCYVYMGEDDRIYSGQGELPFAQFADLDSEYDKEAITSVTMAVSNAECQLAEDTLAVKCGLIGQYVIHDRRIVELAEDAYSPLCAVNPSMSQLELPAMLDSRSESVEAELELPGQAETVVDVEFLPDHPLQYREEDQVTMELPGQFQVLYYDREGNLQSAGEHWAGQTRMTAGEGCHVNISLRPNHQATATPYGDRLRLHCGMEMQVQTTAKQQIPMLTGLEIGELTEPDPQRPSLILRRSGEWSLWELAKACGSTVEAIQKANHLTDEPAPNQMLLIPVI